jgi:hypothetical protein
VVGDAATAAPRTAQRTTRRVSPGSRRVADSHERRGQGRRHDAIFGTVGIITDPVVVIENVVTGAIEHHVISSLNFAEYDRLQRLRPDQLPTLPLAARRRYG